MRTRTKETVLREYARRSTCTPVSESALRCVGGRCPVEEEWFVRAWASLVGQAADTPNLDSDFELYCIVASYSKWKCIQGGSSGSIHLDQHRRGGGLVDTGASGRTVASLEDSEGKGTRKRRAYQLGRWISETAALRYPTRYVTIQISETSFEKEKTFQERKILEK